ncbi:amino acid adenylation domain-containing protein [Salmonella enterica]|nr:amino acid adenylation domain-containing protein [Salmonella enterica]
MTETYLDIHSSPTQLHLFFAAADRYPLRIAISDTHQDVSYATLRGWISGIVRALHNAGISSGDRVAVALPPGAGLIASLIAIQYTGAAYIPLDRNAPQERNNLILDDARPKLVINEDGESSFPNCPAMEINQMLAAPATESVNAALPSGVAYIIYTSGTTGRPKGVPITHASLRALFQVTESFFHFNEHDSTLLYHSYAFDFSVWEIWSVLAYGGRLVIPDDDIRLTPAKLAQLIHDQNITLLNQTPRAFSINAPWLCRFQKEALALRFIIFGGERLNFQTLTHWQRHFGLSSPKLVNMYGITETTVHSSWHIISGDDMDKDESVIGELLPGFRYLIRPSDNETQQNEGGELLLSGPQVTSGYLNQDNETNGKFVSIESNRVFYRYYCTGDIVKHNAAGKLVYLGRCDQQVKINGYRIETGEIESLLARHEAIRDISVIASDSTTHGPHLVCCFTTSSDNKKNVIPELRALAKQTLPIYMRPVHYRRLDIMPKTINGKIDKQSLRISLE